ncbi:MAG: tetrahydrofolate dehydrogenase/cyclohydrolase catalytic domain-containing protein [Bacteroidota bacterium]|nr:bifunctional 5,10-methylene-tetrahydrofolate dehydrogenase/5,10-methylene-tetrahydrofolate cyclohydrolase [bacterium]NBP63942.1 bifunctional 5,10-methylene-tetrahydrofolate dehydrogenase/5,10-methylene-tetrahydrofolate cyclohydrolase [Bacteroidota bacterium]
MNPLILDGKVLAKNIEQTLAERTSALLRHAPGRTPILATILVGNDPASATYVKMKGNACRRIGMDSRSIELSEQTTTEELTSVINELNADPNVHGILLQHPVPHQIDERYCFDAIALEKDVDGVTCLGFGRMSMGSVAYGSATPAGIMTLLKHYEIPMKGKHAVILGRSPILGKPMAAMVLNEDCTVTICHSRTQDLPSHVKQADILIAAVGKPAFVQESWIKPGSVIVDAGYHPGGIGDVDPKAFALASAYTPVPGGVGPMTISTLMSQTLSAAELALGI